MRSGQGELDYVGPGWTWAVLVCFRPGRTVSGWFGLDQAGLGGVGLGRVLSDIMQGRPVLVNKKGELVNPNPCGWGRI